MDCFVYDPVTGLCVDGEPCNRCLFDSFAPDFSEEERGTSPQTGCVSDQEGE